MWKESIINTGEKIKEVTISATKSAVETTKEYYHKTQKTLEENHVKDKVIAIPQKTVEGCISLLHVYLIYFNSIHLKLQDIL